MSDAPRWWRPAAWLYIFGDSPIPGRRALGVVANIEPWNPWAAGDDADVFNDSMRHIRLVSGSMVCIDVKIAACLHGAKKSGWYGATQDKLLGPFSTPELAKVEVEATITNSSSSSAEVADEAHI